jgi:hypothetical protein
LKGVILHAHTSITNRDKMEIAERSLRKAEETRREAEKKRASAETARVRFPKDPKD